METFVLDQPETKTIEVFDNKTGGPYTTPAFYIGIGVFCIGGWLFGLLGYLLSIPFFISSSRTAVNISTRTMCSYWRICGLNVGADNWQPLPEINAITIIRVKWTRTYASRGSQTTMSDFTYKVKMSGGNRKVWELLTTENKNEAKIKGEQIAGALGVKLVDYSVPGTSTSRARRR